MGTAIVAGGLGVLLLIDTGNSKYYVKDAVGPGLFFWWVKSSAGKRV
jgi:hypothetical protein